jgi:hypothetical protein
MAKIEAEMPVACTLIYLCTIHVFVMLVHLGRRLYPEESNYNVPNKVNIYTFLFGLLEENINSKTRTQKLYF